MEHKTTPMRFIGQDRSMGLRNGQVYELELRPMRKGLQGVIYATGVVYCPYISSYTFFQNWETA